MMGIQKKFVIAGTIFFVALAIILLCAWGVHALYLNEEEPKAPDYVDESVGESADYVDEGEPEIPDPVEPGTLPAEAGEGRYVIVGSGDERILFLNQVDGYGVSLPQSMRVTESTSMNLRVVLEDDHIRMEIYKQPLKEKKISAGTYLSYSNGFLKNTDDHRLELKKNIKINGYQAKLTQWSRNKLQRLENDKNHYACIDIRGKDFVYTFFIKSDAPLEEAGGYAKLVQGFYTFDPATEPNSPAFRQTENAFRDPETKAFYEKYFMGNGNLTWGIFKYSAPEDMSELKAIEDKFNYEFKFLLVYKHIQKTYPEGYVKNTLESAYHSGRTVELTLQATGQDKGEGNMVYDVLDGKYDAFLQSFARETAQFGHPVLFRLCNEMNGDWCSYSAYHTSRDTEIYKEFYQYVYGIFRNAGADNVIWVWNPNEKSFPDFKWNNEALYYPGDEYVDVVGLTGYNTGTYHKGESWRSFREIYDPLYEKMTRLSDKPLMITEFSSSSVGGNKEEWVKDMFLCLGQYPRIRVAVWWDGCDWDSAGNVTRPYFIDESPELTQVFRTCLQDYQCTVLGGGTDGF